MMASGRNRKDLSSWRVGTAISIASTPKLLCVNMQQLGAVRVGLFPKRRQYNSTLHYRCPANVIAATSSTGHAVTDAAMRERNLGVRRS